MRTTPTTAEIGQEMLRALRAGELQSYQYTYEAVKSWAKALEGAGMEGKEETKRLEVRVAELEGRVAINTELLAMLRRELDQHRGLITTLGRIVSTINDTFSNMLVTVQAGLSDSGDKD